MDDILKHISDMKLDDRHCSVLVGEVSGLTTGELATLLNCSQRTVRALKVEARKAVKVHYDNADDVVRLIDGCRE